MDSDAFWALIEAARAEAADPTDAEAVAAGVVARLVAGGVDLVDGYEAAAAVEDARAYGWPLWGAAYLVNGGCSDDGFDYFLGWLLAQGREVFERAVADPDSLADVVGPDDEGDVESEEMLGAPGTARRQLTGSYGGGPVRERLRADLDDEPDWDFDDADQMQQRYPRLAAVFG